MFQLLTYENDLVCPLNFWISLVCGPKTFGDFILGSANHWSVFHRPDLSTLKVIASCNPILESSSYAIMQSDILSLEDLGSSQEFKIISVGQGTMLCADGLAAGSCRGEEIIFLTLCLSRIVCLSSSAYLLPCYSLTLSLSLICHSVFNLNILLSLHYSFLWHNC